MSTATLSTATIDLEQAQTRRRRQDSTHLVAPPAPYAGPERRTHLFVHTVRFWCMVAIIAQHSATSMSALVTLKPWVSMLLIQPLKFGTIGFFLISGFLMGDRLDDSQPLGYLYRRAKRLLGPWCFWLGMLVAYVLAGDVAHHRVNAGSLHSLVVDAFSVTKDSLIHTAFWFVPNLLVSMACLMALRRRLYDLRVGLGLLAINLFYVVNIYALWVPSLHSEATLGFLVYLWLGAYCARHAKVVLGWIGAVRGVAVVAAVAGCCVAAMAESHLLGTMRGVADPTNTLRISNQMFSVAVVVMLVRVRSANWPRFVDVPKDTYGLHLIHTMLLIQFRCVLRRVFNAVGWAGHWYFAPLVWGMLFVAVYGVSLWLTRAMARSARLQGLVGVVPDRRGAASLVRMPEATKLLSA